MTKLHIGRNLSVKKKKSVISFNTCYKEVKCRIFCDIVPTTLKVQIVR
jgi:hypothetical protein